jgi:hypothetical protein
MITLRKAALICSAVEDGATPKMVWGEERVEIILRCQRLLTTGRTTLLKDIEQAPERRES